MIMRSGCGMQDQARYFNKLRFEFKKLNSLTLAMHALDPGTLREFFPKLEISGVGGLGSSNIKMLLDSLDPHLLSEKGLFVFLDKFNPMEMGACDEQRIIGLLKNGQWLVIKIYPYKILEMPDNGIELRDCFSLIRMSFNEISFRNLCDILFVPPDIKNLSISFYEQIMQLVDQQEKKMEILKQTRCKTEEILREVLEFFKTP